MTTDVPTDTPTEPDSTATEQPAAPPPTSSGILARAQASAGGRVREGAEAWVFSFRDQVAELLAGRVRDVDGYLFNVFRTIGDSKGLRESTRSSLGGAILLGATLGFEVGGPLGHYYLTPRWNRNAIRVVDGVEVRGSNECVPVIGYRGFFELGYRSGHVAAYEYVRVREGDEYEDGADSDRGVWWRWARGEGDNTRPLTHVVAIAKLINGQRSSLPMTLDEILNRRPTQYEKTPWGRDPIGPNGVWQPGPFFDAMATKTPFREQAKFMRLSTDLALAADADEMVSNWNRETQAIETRHNDDEPVTITGDAALTADGGNGADAGEAGRSQENAPEPVPVGREGAARPSDGGKRNSWDTSNVAAADLPEVVRQQNRSMTDDEYERYSAWEAGQAGAGS